MSNFAKRVGGGGAKHPPRFRRLWWIICDFFCPGMYKVAMFRKWYHIRLACFVHMWLWRPRKHHHRALVYLEKATGAVYFAYYTCMAGYDFKNVFKVNCLISNIYFASNNEHFQNIKQHYKYFFYPYYMILLLDILNILWISLQLFKVEMAVKIGLTKSSSTSEACEWNSTFQKEVNII